MIYKKKKSSMFANVYVNDDSATLKLFSLKQFCSGSIFYMLEKCVAICLKNENIFWEKKSLVVSGFCSYYDLPMQTNFTLIHCIWLIWFTPQPEEPERCQSLEKIWIIRVKMWRFREKKLTLCKKIVFFHICICHFSKYHDFDHSFNQVKIILAQRRSGILCYLSCW